jgi:hypothetical protein
MHPEAAAVMGIETNLAGHVLLDLAVDDRRQHGAVDEAERLAVLDDRQPHRIAGAADDIHDLAGLEAAQALALGPRFIAHIDIGLDQVLAGRRRDGHAHELHIGGTGLGHAHGRQAEGGGAQYSLPDAAKPRVWPDGVHRLPPASTSRPYPDPAENAMSSA